MKQRLQSQWPIASFWLIRKRRFPIKIQVKEISGNLCKRSVRMIQEARYETKASITIAHCFILVEEKRRVPIKTQLKVISGNLCN